MYIVTLTNGSSDTVIYDGRKERGPRIKGGVLSYGINAIDGLTFDIYPDNPGYELLESLTTRISVRELKPGLTRFVGRVLVPQETMDSQGKIFKRVTCEGRLGWLCDTVQPYKATLPTTVRGKFTDMIAEHNAQAPGKAFTVGQTTVPGSNSYHYVYDYSSTLQTISEKLIDVFGGELQIRDVGDTVYLDLLTQVGHGTDVTIEKGVELLSYERSADGTSVITRLYPLGARDEDGVRLTIASANSGLEYIEDSALVAKYGVISGSMTWDEVTIAANLKTKAQAWMSSQKSIREQYRISAIDPYYMGLADEPLELGCTYRVKLPKVSGGTIQETEDKDLRLIELKIPMDTPWRPTLTFGDRFETATQLQAKKSRAVQSQLNTQPVIQSTIMSEKIDNATAMITGADGGHVVLYPSENPDRILIMDTADVSTAQSCLQLNKNGLGFWTKGSTSTTPLTGTYTNAWTIDGNLVASFITALTLTGLKINNGNGTFVVDENGNVTAKSINIKGGSIDIETGDQNTDLIRLNHDEWTMEISPLQVKVTNDNIGGYIVLQAGAINCYWNDELKVNISSDYGNITTKAGNTTFYLDTNGRALTMYNSSGARTIYMDAENGDIYCSGSFRQL